MATVVVRPNKNRPIPRKECIKYCIIPTEFALDVGSMASAYIDFNGTAYAGGISFIFANVQFTTSSSPFSTFNTFQINGSGQSSAQNFETTLNLNPNFAGTNIFVSDQGGGTWRVLVSWPTIGELDPFEFDFSNFSPVPPNSNTNGTNPQIREGFKFTYQIWGVDSNGLKFPVTEKEAVTPRLTSTGIPRICFDFQDTVQGLVYTTFPGFDLADATYDPNFSQLFYLKYGGYQNDNCQVTEFETAGSPNDGLTIINSVVKIDSLLKMKPYNWFDSQPATFKLLTARPEVIEINRDSYHWVWAYATVLGQSAIYSKYRARWVYYDSAGSILGAPVGAELTEDGVIIIPCGPNNSPLFPVGCMSYTVALQAFNVNFSSWQDITDETTFNLKKGDCPSTEIYFTEDLGSLSTMSFDEIELVTHEMDNQVFERAENCPDDIYLPASIENRLRAGGKTRSNIKTDYLYRCSIRGMDNDEMTYDWFRQFRDAEQHFHRYTTTEGDEVARKIILEKSDLDVSKDGEYLTLEIEFRYHTPIR
jgi:hypothetical protein